MTMEKLAALPPAFKKGGTVTAGNACGINDAAAAVILMTEKRAKELGMKPLARIVGYAVAGRRPGDHGHRAGACDEEGPRQGGPSAWATSSLSRSTRPSRPSTSRARGADRLEQGDRKRQRQRHIPGPPRGVHGREARSYAASRDDEKGPASRAGYALRGRRPGLRVDPGKIEKITARARGRAPVGASKQGARFTFACPGGWGVWIRLPLTQVGS